MGVSTSTMGVSIFFPLRQVHRLFGIPYSVRVQQRNGNCPFTRCAVPSRSLLRSLLPTLIVAVRWIGWFLSFKIFDGSA